VRALDLIDVHDQVVECKFCHRKWRLPADGRINDLNWEYLLEHTQPHVFLHRMRPKQWHVLPRNGKPPLD
jgi:hypothetical protein